MLTLAKNSISGTVMGTLVNAFTLDGSADATPPPGEYDLLPPLEDPIFGTYIIAMSRGAGLKPGYDFRKLSTEPLDASSYGDLDLSAAAFRYKRIAAPAEEGFVLSKQPIPGRNCIVVASGFSDLLDALKGAPEAALTVI